MCNGIALVRYLTGDIDLAYHLQLSPNSITLACDGTQAGISNCTASFKAC